VADRRPAKRFGVRVILLSILVVFPEASPGILVNPRLGPGRSQQRPPAAQRTRPAEGGELQAAWISAVATMQDVPRIRQVCVASNCSGD
jgi:hypothetical protein